MTATLGELDRGGEGSGGKLAGVRLLLAGTARTTSRSQRIGPSSTLTIGTRTCGNRAIRRSLPRRWNRSRRAVTRCCVRETHNHWAVGHVDGFSVRVYRHGRITRAFRTWHKLQTRMAEYPLLDEDDHFHRYYEATIENIADAAWRVKRDYHLPRGWEVKVYHWLAEHDLSEIEDAR